MLESSLGNGWFFAGFYLDAYDKNGDVRVLGLINHEQPLFNQKIHDGAFYTPDQTGDFPILYKLNLIG